MNHIILPINLTTHDLRLTSTAGDEAGYEQLHQKKTNSNKEMELCWWIGTFGLIDHLYVCTASRTLLIEENMQNE